jgi:hypothetical protein
VSDRRKGLRKILAADGVGLGVQVRGARSLERRD